MSETDSAQLAPPKHQWFNGRAIALLILLAAVISASAIVADILSRRDRIPARPTASEPAP